VLRLVKVTLDALHLHEERRARPTSARHDHQDNLYALRIYQRRGFRLIGLRPGAIERGRTLKPLIPRLGCYDIPIRDEIQLERVAS